MTWPEEVSSGFMRPFFYFVIPAKARGGKCEKNRMGVVKMVLFGYKFNE